MHTITQADLPCVSLPGYGAQDARQAQLQSQPLAFHCWTLFTALLFHPSAHLLCPLGLEEALKELKGKDNILPKLMGAGAAEYDGLHYMPLPACCSAPPSIPYSSELAVQRCWVDVVALWHCRLAAAVLQHEWLSHLWSAPVSVSSASVSVCLCVFVCVYVRMCCVCRQCQH